jgi:hypothetical protein
MEFKILNFNKTERRLQNEYAGELLTVPDYFQWYISGVENVINENPSSFILTDRYDNERTEVLAYGMYQNENVADLLVLLNNDNFLWDAPADYDLLWDVTENKLQYIEKLHRVDLSEEQELYWRSKMEEKTSETYNTQRTLVVPLKKDLSKIIRKVNKYIEGREVK